MVKSKTERIGYLGTKIRKDKKELKSMKKDLGRVKRWEKKNPTRNLDVPFMGAVNVKQQIRQGERKIKEQADEIKRRKMQLRTLKK